MATERVSDLMSGVCVVVTTFNHAHFLDEALESVARQTHPVEQVVVVDDGSTDDPAAVVSRWPFAQLIRQDNHGLSSARNTGLRATSQPLVVFLDADDLLEPSAVEAGRRCALEHGDVAFVYGAHRRCGADGRLESGKLYQPLADDAMTSFLRGNVVGMHATVLYRSTILRESGGFDERLTTCEDYDVYLRLARGHRVATHSEPVARYRWHGLNMSRDHLLMQRSALQVQRRYRPERGDLAPRRLAYRQGRKIWRDYYAQVAVHEARAEGRSVVSSFRAALAHQPTAGLLGRSAAHLLEKSLRRARGLFRSVEKS